MAWLLSFDVEGNIDFSLSEDNQMGGGDGGDGGGKNKIIIKTKELTTTPDVVVELR